MTISKEEFAQWANSTATIAVRNKLAEEASAYATLNFSLADKAAHTLEGDYDLETLGLDAAMRMSIVKGIELFTDMDNLEGLMDFPEEVEDEGV